MLKNNWMSIFLIFSSTCPQLLAARLQEGDPLHCKSASKSANTFSSTPPHVTISRSVCVCVEYCVYVYVCVCVSVYMCVCECGFGVCALCVSLCVCVCVCV